MAAARVEDRAAAIGEGHPVPCGDDDQPARRPCRRHDVSGWAGSPWGHDEHAGGVGRPSRAATASDAIGDGPQVHSVR
ncbi:MAG TPA: hypothetical protein VFU25_08445, partial [Ornithinibacter sp.]|nr:hypothetical protein [Ornithinibacter sp.]